MAIWCVLGQNCPDKNFAQFYLKSPLEFVFPKNTFSVWTFVLNRTSPIFLAKRTTCGQKCPEWSFVHPKNDVFGWNFLIKAAPYLFSGPNWLYGAFGGKIVPDENFAQFCRKSPLVFVFPKNTFSVWIFLLNRTSPIFMAKRTRWHVWGKSVTEWSFVHPKKHVFGWNFLVIPVPYRFSGSNWVYGAFKGKIVPDENVAQFCLKSPFEFVFPKNTFSVWIFELNRTSPIFFAKWTRWHDWG